MFRRRVRLISKKKMTQFAELPVLTPNALAEFIREHGFEIGEWPQAFLPASHVKACMAYHDLLIEDYSRCPDPKDPVLRRKALELERQRLHATHPILRTTWGYLTADSHYIPGVQMCRSFQINVPGFSQEHESMSGFDREMFQKEVRKAFRVQLKKRLHNALLPHEVCSSIGDAVVSVLVVARGTRPHDAIEADKVISALLEQTCRAGEIESHLVRARLSADQMLSLSAVLH